MTSIVFVVLVFCASIFAFSEATICKPLSKFKIDCNTCICSDDGKEYTCSKYVCPIVPRNHKFIEEDGEDGYVLLKPRESNEKYVLDDDDSFVLTKQQRKSRLPHLTNEIQDINNIYNDFDNYALPDLEEARHANEDIDNDNYEEVNDVNEESEWEDFVPRIKRTLKI